MLGSSVLEVAIGIVFIYLALSMACTILNEGIATLINQRGKHLFAGIKNLLNDPAFTGLAQQVYSHGLVDGISQDAADPNTPTRSPSYMPSKTFALALLDVLGTHGVVAAAHGELLSTAEKADDAYQAAKGQPDAATKQKAADQGRAALVAAETQATAAYQQALQAPAPDPAAVAQARKALDAAGAAVKMLDARRAAVDSADSPKDLEKKKRASDTLEAALVAGRTLAAGVPDQLANFQAAVHRLPDGHTKETLLVLIDKTKREATAAGAQVVRFREEVESWFNDAMDRVGGWYKRWTQKTLLILAFVLVCLLNADTILLVHHLSIDKDLRASFLQKAQDINNVEQVRAKMDTLSLPLGWSRDPKNDRRFPWITNSCDGFEIFGSLLKKLLGLLLSVAAISLGAPFWFDTLSKFINLRGAGTPPGEKTKSAPQSQAKAG
jgi:hypothetical protein